MVVFNYSGGEINAKIVYYGPGLSGKTTNLEYIYTKMPAKIKGKMISMKTRTDRTLFFDFLPLELGDINGFKVRFLLYTVPGQVYYNATRKLVLKGADAVVFVADSDGSKMSENIESLKNLEENLNEHNLSLEDIPWVIQYNKRDLETALPVAELEEKLNVLNVPSFEAVATKGTGVYETFQTISSLLYKQVKSRMDEEGNGEEQKDAAEEDELVKAKAGAQVAAKSGNSDEGSVSQVIEVALREVRREKLGETQEKEGNKVVVPPEASRGNPESRKTLSDEPLPSPEEKSSAESFERMPAKGLQDGAKKKEKPLEEDEFQFESLADVEMDEGVGRVLDLDKTPEAGARAESEFITDPCKGTLESKKDDSKGVAEEIHKSPLSKELSESDGDDYVVRVPVVITRSQVKKKVPLKLVLEIQVLDEES